MGRPHRPGLRLRSEGAPAPWYTAGCNKSSFKSIASFCFGPHPSPPPSVIFQAGEAPGWEPSIQVPVAVCPGGTAGHPGVSRSREVNQRSIPGNEGQGQVGRHLRVRLSGEERWESLWQGDPTCPLAHSSQTSISSSGNIFRKVIIMTPLKSTIRTETETALLRVHRPRGPPWSLGHHGLLGGYLSEGKVQSQGPRGQSVFPVTCDTRPPIQGRSALWDSLLEASTMT